jgi:hypothetical protein
LGWSCTGGRDGGWLGGQRLRGLGDILRAAGLPLLAGDDPEVVKDVKKVASGEPLSPILLVRGDLAAGRPLQIADGYHRVCASYHLGEDTETPCRIADVPGASVRRNI